MDEHELSRREGAFGAFIISSLFPSSPFNTTSHSTLHPSHLTITAQRIAQSPTSPHAPKARDLYTRLRQNLVNTVFNSWQETGFAWEQYNPETGRGQRTQHFTGWTSLVVKVMGMPALGKGTGHDEL